MLVYCTFSPFLDTTISYLELCLLTNLMIALRKVSLIIIETMRGQKMMEKVLEIIIKEKEAEFTF